MVHGREVAYAMGSTLGRIKDTGPSSLLGLCLANQVNAKSGASPTDEKR